MGAATARDYWARCSHRQRLQLPQPQSLIAFCSLHWQWICTDCAGFLITDGGRKDFKTAERSGSDNNAGFRAGFNATCWVCLWGSSGCRCTQHGGWSIYWLSLHSGRGGSHRCSDICNARIVQRRSGGGVLTLDCRGYGTPSFRLIPGSSRYGNASLSMGQLRIPWRPTGLLILTICKTSNILYDRRCGRRRALGMHHPIWMFDVNTVGIISSSCKYNGRWGRLIFEQSWRDWTEKEGAL